MATVDDIVNSHHNKFLPKPSPTKKFFTATTARKIFPRHRTHITSSTFPPNSVQTMDPNVAATFEGASSEASPFSSPSSSAPPIDPNAEYFWPIETTDRVVSQSRHIRVTNVDNLSSPSALKLWMDQFGSLRGLYTEKLLNHGVIYVSFFDLRASILCYETLQKHTEMTPTYCIRTLLADVIGNFSAYPMKREGELRVDIVSRQPGAECDANFFYSKFLEVGDLYGIQTEGSRKYDKIWIEFYDIRLADKAIELLDNQIFKGLQIKISHSENTHVGWSRAYQMVEIHEDQNLCLVHSGTREHVAHTNPAVDLQFANAPATGQIGGRNVGVSSCNAPPGFEGVARTQNMTLQAAHWPTKQHLHKGPNFNLAGGQKPFQLINRNILDLVHVKKGLDPRSTIMVRNIPNRLTQAEVKDWMDKTASRRYDFMYLRIDFQNECNVGYCFVNFINLQWMAEFIESRIGETWIDYGSDKVVEVSYANIQGKHALIEKFRNSSVMDQEFGFRPRAFHTSGPEQGLDMEFPPPNNLARKLRSVTAAQQSGLYNRGYRYPGGARGHRLGGFTTHITGIGYTAGYRRPNGDVEYRSLESFINRPPATHQSNVAGLAPIQQLVTAGPAQPQQLIAAGPAQTQQPIAADPVKAQPAISEAPAKVAQAIASSPMKTLPFVASSPAKALPTTASPAMVESLPERTIFGSELTILAPKPMRVVYTPKKANGPSPPKCLAMTAMMDYPGFFKNLPPRAYPAPTYLPDSLVQDTNFGIPLCPVMNAITPKHAMLAAASPVSPVMTPATPGHITKSGRYTTLGNPKTVAEFTPRSFVAPTLERPGTSLGGRVRLGFPKPGDERYKELRKVWKQ